MAVEVYALRTEGRSKHLSYQNKWKFSLPLIFDLLCISTEAALSGHLLSTLCLIRGPSIIVY